MTLRLLELSFNMLQLLLEEVDHFLVVLCRLLLGHLGYLIIVALLLFLFEGGRLSLKLLNDLLAEVRSLGQLLLHVLVDADLTFKPLDGLLHLVVLEQQLLSLLRLMVQLGSQLMILQDLEARRRLHLLLVERDQVGLGLRDLVLHLLLQLGDGLEFFALLLIDLLHVFFLAIFDHEVQLSQVVLQLPLSCKVGRVLADLALESGQIGAVLVYLLLVCLSQLQYSFVIFFLNLLLVVLKLDLLGRQLSQLHVEVLLLILIIPEARLINT